MPAPQTILLFAGMMALVVAAVLLGIAVRTYFVLDIRGVRDDLAGKTRNTTGRASANRHHSHRQRTDNNARRADAQEYSEIQVEDSEDEVDTEIGTVSAPRKIAVGQKAIDLKRDKDDEIPTAVDERTDIEDDTSTVVFAEEDYSNMAHDAPLSPKPTSEAKDPKFVLLKRIVIIHSDEIIAVE